MTIDLSNTYLFEPMCTSTQARIASSPHTSSHPSAIRKLWSNSSARAGIFILGFIALMAIIGPSISSYQYDETNLHLKNSSPSIDFWFGTDDLGRDIFTRVWYGARISLAVGIAAACIDVAIGIVWGGIAAYLGGIPRIMMMRMADILYSLPYLLIVTALMVVLKPGFISILLAMTCLGWITMARIVHGHILQLKKNDYILAAQSIGAPPWRIISYHLIPNAIGPIIVTLTLTIPSAIFTEAFLSFLGLGIQAPIASWGSMANEGLPALQFYPWRLFFPALFISLTMLGFHLVGDALRDVLDTSTKGGMG